MIDFELKSSEFSDLQVDFKSQIEISKLKNYISKYQNEMLFQNAFQNLPFVRVAFMHISHHYHRTSYILHASHYRYITLHSKYKIQYHYYTTYTYTYTYRAITFVGSSPIAKLISERCHKLHKRCIALGGAKNHLIALPDCDIEDTARDIVVSSAGCAGQRCMAASVLLLVGGPHADADGNSDGADSVGVARLQEKLIQKVVEKAKGIGKGLGPGQIGPVIDQASFEKIHKYIREAEQSGAEILLDGRSWDCEEGHWVGPTIIKHASKDDSAMKEEIFGPVLSVYTASSWTEAIEIENSNPFGNAACIYTSNGGYAEWFTRRFRAAMLGVNVGIPVPREPFSFGGLYGTCSKYGDMDITGDGAMEFFSNRIKITTKWIVPKIDEPSITNGPVDQANFAGTM